MFNKAVQHKASKFFTLLIFIVLINSNTQAQIILDTNVVIKELVEKYLIGKGIKVGNITFTGNKSQIAHFIFQNTPIDITNGIVLSTGDVSNIAGPNTFPYTTTAYGNLAAQKKLKGDKDLNRIGHNYSYDVASIEFDFIPLDNKISFTYSFGSEEYPEYVNSRYNDVFGFFISGPKYKNKNLAVLPLSTTPITINSINNRENKNAYIDNDLFTDIVLIKDMPGKKKKTTNDKKNSKAESFDIDFKINKRKQKKLNQKIYQYIQYDGMTKALVAWCYVEPYQKYHLKIAIADIGDNSYDSGVFLQEGAFNSSKDTKKPGFKDYADRSAKINYDSLLYGWPLGNPIKIKPNKQDSIDEAEETENAKFQITNINFETDSYVLPDTAQNSLKDLIVFLKKQRKFRCELYGYTDNQGNKEYNQKLSDNRAQNVMNFMVARGINKDRIKILGYNFERPLADNNSETGRSRNRRVEIILEEDIVWIEQQKKIAKDKAAAATTASKPITNKTNKKK